MTKIEEISLEKLQEEITRRNQEEERAAQDQLEPLREKAGVKVFCPECQTEGAKMWLEEVCSICSDQKWIWLPKPEWRNYILEEQFDEVFSAWSDFTKHELIKP